MTTIPMEPGPVDAFMQAHPERGALRIQVTAGPFPVAGAQVEVFRLFGQLRQVFYRGVTDQSGILQRPTIRSRYATRCSPPTWGGTPPSTRARRRSSSSRSSRCCKEG